MKPVAVAMVYLALTQLTCVACHSGLSAPGSRNGISPRTTSPRHAPASINPLASPTPEVATSAAPQVTPGDAGVLPEVPACKMRSSLPSAPRLVFAAPRIVEQAPSAGSRWERELLDAMWNWTIVEADGLPAVSEDGHTVLLMEDARLTTTPPRFDVRIVERDVEHTRPDRVTTLITRDELNAALPSWPEGKVDDPGEVAAYESAQSRFDVLQQKVRARIERAQVRLAAQRWVPMPWCKLDNRVDGEPSGRVDDLVISLSPPTASKAPVLRVKLDAGPPVLDQSDPALAARPQTGRWGRCTYVPRLSGVAADNVRHVIIVTVDQVATNDMCDAVPTVQVYRLKSWAH